MHREQRSRELATTEPRPKPHGHPANGTTKVRWLLSRQSAGRHRPKRARGSSQPTPNRVSPQPTLSLSPTTSPVACPRSGTGGFKATLLSPTPSTPARAHRAHGPRAPLTRTRYHRTPSQAARPPRQRHDEGKVAFKPPIRWTPPAKTRSRELSTNAQPRFAPTNALAPANHVPCRLPPQRDGRL
jgi:hypothetical protein